MPLTLTNVSNSNPVVRFVSEVTVRMIYYMREWLSGRASPCQGEGRGFESRLAL